MSSTVRYRVRGGAALTGTVFVQGAKNAALPLIGAALMARSGRTVLRNVPAIDDVRRAAELARHLGATVEFHEAERTIIIDAANVTESLLPAALTQRFRGSVLFIPAVLHRVGAAIYEGVGGCNLGTRALDFHYRGFARLGASAEETSDRIEIKAGGRMRGAELYLDTPSHTGTENLLMAAALTPGRTVIENAAQEPEVADVIACLVKMGAQISGVGTGRLVVDGVAELTGVEYTVMPDRLDAGVMAMAVGITGGSADLIGASLDHFGVVKHKCEQMGIHLRPGAGLIHAERPGVLAPINVITDTYPGFATDLQSPLAAVATQADGVSYIRERIFDGRWAVMDELARLGADTRATGETATIRGRSQLTGAQVTAHDLRSGVALVLAGLVADGETVIDNGSMIDRGHATLAERLTGLGADIIREVVG